MGIPIADTVSLRKDRDETCWSDGSESLRICLNVLGRIKRSARRQHRILRDSLPNVVLNVFFRLCPPYSRANLREK